MAEVYCLIVDPNNILPEGWRESLLLGPGAISQTYVTSFDEATLNIMSGTVVALVVAIESSTVALHSLLESFQQHVGAFAEFQLILCDDPSPEMLTSVFEFGIEQFSSLTNFAHDASSLINRVSNVLADETTAESRILKMNRAVREGRTQDLEAQKAELSELTQYDFRAAFVQGKVHEATGDYESAIASFSSARKMNQMFRPSTSKLSEAHMIAGQYDEAISLMSELEKTNSSDFNRKANLAAAYTEKGDYASAEKYLAEAKNLGGDHPRIKEVNAQICLCTGKINDALAIMDTMQEVGPFFAAKLNEMGIKLSQAGDGKSAIALYQKAHKIVRPDLRYKISLNAALACRRLNRPDLALKYLDRCQTEFGSSFPKLEKIRAAVKQMIAGTPEAKPEAKMAG
jgi:tetratricopeptide (TPR) repeat protein